MTSPEMEMAPSPLLRTAADATDGELLSLAPPTQQLGFEQLLRLCSEQLAACHLQELQELRSSLSSSQQAVGVDHENGSSQSEEPQRSSLPRKQTIIAHKEAEITLEEIDNAGRDLAGRERKESSQPPPDQGHKLQAHANGGKSPKHNWLALPGSLKPDQESSQSSSPRGKSPSYNRSVQQEFSTFPLRDTWKFKLDAFSPNRKSLSMPVQSSFERAGSEVSESSSDSEAKIQDYEGNMKAFIAYPGSKYRVFWDLIGGILILYDLILIPMKVFEMPETTFLITMDWITLIFWTGNVGATLTSGFVKQGVTIMSPSRILFNYLKTWCIVDCVVLGPDWAFTILASGSGTESVKMLRMLRLARTVRLLRLFKLKWILDSINDYLDSEFMSIITNIVKMVLFLLAINHFIACMWFLITSDSGDGLNWIKKYGYEDVDWSMQYLTAFHWSITQFTPAGMEVNPTNETERIFTLCVVVFALVGFSYVVGSITGSLTQLRGLSEQATKEFWLLRRFLKRNEVPQVLALRIQRFVEHAFHRQQKQMSVKQVKILALLSDQLMEELQCCMNLPHMNAHPLFQWLNSNSIITMQRLAKEAVGRMHLAKGDTLFLQGQDATCMYFVVSGRILYLRNSEDSPETNEKEFVDAGEDWIAEPILWTPSWVHVGNALAYTDCEMQTVDPKAFARILGLVKPVLAIVSSYGSSFMSWMEEQSGFDDLNDVIQGDKVSDVIRSFIPASARSKTKSKQPSESCFTPKA